MNLITDGKTNLKYILIVLIFAALVEGGILVWQYWWLPKQEIKLPEITIKSEIASWQTYRNEELAFEIKFPQLSDNWQSDIRINNKKPKVFDGLFSSNEGRNIFRLKINLFGERTPIFPEGNFIGKEDIGYIFDNKINETIFTSQNDSKENSILSTICLNKELKVENPEPDLNASEANLKCSMTNYDLYDFNLYCKGQDEQNCRRQFNQILSTFKFIK